MLHYEDVIYEDVKESCKFPRLEMLIESNIVAIEKVSKETGVDINTLKKQIRLIAPQFEHKNYYGYSFFNNSIVPLLKKSFSNYTNDIAFYRENAGVSNMTGKYRIIKKSYGCRWIVDETTGIKTEVLIKEVGKQEADFIEYKLHYLRSPRNDAVYRFGMFLKGYSWPFCYMSFSKIDRPDKVEAFRKSTSIHVNDDEVLELSRVFGYGNLPKNTVSSMIGFCSCFFKRKGYRYIITAVNITLGFTGSSMIASGFIPYATRPVVYQYDRQGQYSSRRINPNAQKRSRKMPPNILYAKEIQNVSGKVVKYCKMVDISNNYSFNESAIEHEIYTIRKELEELWSEKTRYHGVIGTPKIVSKGQCGVSSLLLARILENKGYDVFFCEGNAIFMDNQNNDKGSITNHCWVKINNYCRRGENVIIDITADQNGYTKPIVFMTEEGLKKAHMNYFQVSEKKPDEVNVSHLVQRLEYLESAMKNLRRQETTNYE